MIWMSSASSITIVGHHNLAADDHTRPETVGTPGLGFASPEEAAKNRIVHQRTLAHFQAGVMLTTDGIARLRVGKAVDLDGGNGGASCTTTTLLRPV
jgi:hypothetical protein